MIVGLPREIKDNENRVGMVPAGVKALTAAGHTVYVENDAGVGSGIPDEQYVAAGAKILDEAAHLVVGLLPHRDDRVAVGEAALAEPVEVRGERRERVGLVHEPADGDSHGDT